MVSIKLNQNTIHLAALHLLVWSGTSMVIIDLTNRFFMLFPIDDVIDSINHNPGAALFIMLLPLITFTYIIIVSFFKLEKVINNDRE